MENAVLAVNKVVNKFSCRRLMGFTAIMLLAVGLLAGFMQPASAHALRENYVWVNVEVDHLSGRFEINVRDIKSKLGIDLDAPGADRLSNVKATADQVQAYLAKNFAILDNGKPLKFEFQEAGLFKDGPDFVQYPTGPQGCPVPQPSTL